MATGSASVWGASVSAITRARVCHAGQSGGAGQPGGAANGLPLTSRLSAWLVSLLTVSVSSFNVDFDHGHFGGGLIDDGLVGGEGGHQGLEGQVVHRPELAPTGVVDDRDRLVTEKRAGAAAQGQMMADVGDGLGVWMTGTAGQQPLQLPV